MIDKTFTDLQGNKLSLRQKVFAEPQWAFNRIKELEASTNHESLEAVRAEILRVHEADEYDGSFGLLEAVRIIDKASKGVKGE